MVMKLIVFSKMFKEKSIKELIQIALENQFDGYDLCVRDEYQVNPDNAGSELGKVVEMMRKENLDIPMITSPGDLLFPDKDYVKPLLKAMADNDVKFIKLGYFRIDPETQDYWKEVEKTRQAFSQWEKLAKEYQVKICYHTHSNRCLGLNCAAMLHMIDGFDPECIGAYVDAGHLSKEGAEFAFELAMIKKYLSIIAVKDMSFTREEINGHGKKVFRCVRAGLGIVDWTAVANDLKRIGFNGPVSIHCEFQDAKDDFMAAFKREVKFFRELFNK